METPKEDLWKLHVGLEREKYWGRITQHWQNGEVVLIEKQQTFKPKDFDKVLVVTLTQD